MAKRTWPKRYQIKRYIGSEIYLLTMVDILLTNDDGHASSGFVPLLVELSGQFLVKVVAPSRERSWIGKSISTGRHLSLETITIEGQKVVAVDGTPADCVQIGLHDILDSRPRLVVSGINIGENVGHARILSSGTIGACMEASFEGITAMCASMYMPSDAKIGVDFFSSSSRHMFANATKITARMAKTLLEHGYELGEGVDIISLNMHMDSTVDSQIEVTRPFKASYGQLFHKDGDRFVHKNPLLSFDDASKGSDLEAISEGRISVTPICLDLVSSEAMARVDKLMRSFW